MQPPVYRLGLYFRVFDTSKECNHVKRFNYHLYLGTSDQNTKVNFKMNNQELVNSFTMTNALYFLYFSLRTLKR